MENNPQSLSSEELEIEHYRKLSENQGNDRVVTNFEALAEHRAANRNKGTRHLMYGIKDLDDICDGVKGGNLVVISGYTGHGKTTFSRSITNGFHEWGYKTMWFQYEETLEEFMGRFPEPKPTFHVPMNLEGNSLQWIDDRIVEGIIKYNIDAAFIDHLHYLSDTLTGRNPSLEIGQVMRYLKRKAVKYNIPIFILAHTTKPSESSEPGLGSTRDSSFVEQEADAVFYVWRKPKPESNKNIIKIAKFRRDGSKMGEKIELLFQGGLLWSK